MGIVTSILAGALGVTVMGLVHHVYFDRSGLPDLGPFIRFETPTIGAVYDARGNVLIELAREYRRTVSYDQVPDVLRDAMRELQRRAAGVVWLNPLIDTEGYEPTAAGMSAARPYVASFVSVSDHAGLARLARLMHLRA